MANGSEMVAPLAAVSGFLRQQHGVFIDGEWRPGRGAERLDVFDPATGDVITTVVNANAQDVDDAAQSAHRAFENGAWTGLPAAERERRLLKFADLVEQNAEELAQLETLNQGKSINISRFVDVGGAPAYMRYIAGLTTKITGETFDVSIGAIPGARFNASTRREPVGVVAAIAPWNFPLMIGLWKIMPALAAGCTVVLKPSEVTPLTSVRLMDLAKEAGLPAGVLNLVTGDGRTGKALVDHPLVSKITFTGSTATGKAIARSAADRMLRTSLELGGKNPAIFLADAPIEQAVQGAVMGGFFNNGQVCAASSRLFVARSIYEPFTKALAQAVEGMSIGPGLDPAAQINPVASAGHRQKILDHVQRARQDGARILTGGDSPDRPGYYVRPAVVVDAAADFAISRQEVFGPLVTVTPFDSEDEAVRLANDTDMGLAASVWTNDLKKTMDIVPRIKAGTVWVNCHNLVDPNMPFGGFKESGVGRDFGVRSLEAYTEVKSVCIAY
ncbi:MAG TPA: aldehyde dehydrogenase family protein [Phenylobacterium sp.]|uniref:aldehyde dehydrogenase family protein n=1 Tax=Phenylobacterium sp. TaxID=1871053 RepID=UPI002B490048|nr:aldehyde dehydrogenase family protein [Phenylobacterium sp.]HKR86855.1 aldehyde dehydrogenase family protein [Phenylobacterium sp.]